MAAEVKSALSVRKLPRVVIKHLLSLSFVQIDQPTRVKRPITKVDGKVDILNDTKKSKIETSKKVVISYCADLTFVRSQINFLDFFDCLKMLRILLVFQFTAANMLSVG